MGISDSDAYISQNWGEFRIVGQREVVPVTNSEFM
jgi:hypothetical protein